MMGWKEAADSIMSAIEQNIMESKVKTYDIDDSNTTSYVGDDVARILLSE